MVDIPCFVNGQWVRSQQIKTVSDVTGKAALTLHGADTTNIRIAKRTMLQAREPLAMTPPALLVKIIKDASKDCFPKTELASSLSGSPVSYAKKSAETFSNWMLRIDEYLEHAFGSADYEHITITVGKHQEGYRRYVPAGPVIAVLPSNEYGAAAYVLAQLFLSKNPVLVKPSTQGSSALAAFQFLQALHQSIQRNAPERSYLLNAIQMVNILDVDNRAEQVADLGVAGCSFVIFGSDSSIAEISSKITCNPRAIIKLGTGFSVSAVLSDANITLSVSELFESITEDRGNKCTTTHVIYAHEKIYGQIKTELLSKTKNAKLNALDAETQNAVDKRLAELYPNHEHSGAFRMYELDAHEPVEELPGAIVFLKKIKSVDEFCALFKQDSARNGIQKNLATSIYTANSKTVDEIAARIPSHIVKWNISTNAIDFFMEHQSIFLIKETMRSVVIQTAKPLVEMRT